MYRAALAMDERRRGRRRHHPHPRARGVRPPQRRARRRRPTSRAGRARPRHGEREPLRHASSPARLASGSDSAFSARSSTPTGTAAPPLRRFGRRWRRSRGSVTSGQPALRTRGVDLARVRPIRWAWHRRLPLGSLSSSSARRRRQGHARVLGRRARHVRRTRRRSPGTPAHVLIVGDEDSFEPSGCRASGRPAPT